MSTIRELSKEIHQNAVNKGFWEGEYNTPEKLMLIVSEIAEAMEADRLDFVYKNEGLLYENGIDVFDSDSYKKTFENEVKNRFEDELADAVIRIFDLAEKKGIDLQWHIRAKMRYNSLRPYKHDKKY